VFPELGTYRLGYLSKRLGVGLEQHHRACDDALATARILMKVLHEGHLPREVRTVGQLLAYLG
jgi:DNA polymerase III subunit alpha, Gram-positive type